MSVSGDSSSIIETPRDLPPAPTPVSIPTLPLGVGPATPPPTTRPPANSAGQPPAPVLPAAPPDAPRIPHPGLSQFDFTKPRKQHWLSKFSLRHWLKPKLEAPETPGEHLAQQEAERRKAPSWLVSFVVHLLLLLILALIPIGQLARGPLTLFLGAAGPEGIAEFELAGPESMLEAEAPDADQLEASEQKSLAELLQVEVPTLEGAEAIEPITSPSPLATSAMSEVVPLENIPFGITNGLSGRSGQLKSALLSKFGGTAETEEAVELGLKWLAKQQKSNGSWSLIGPYSLGGTSENTTAATALAINAFLGAGYTHEEGKYRENVKLGLAYLTRRQDDDGFFAEREPSRQQMYAQAIATIAVTEAYGMSGDSDLRIAAQKALGFAEWSQSKLRGWRYEPREDADLSVTGWFVMALETGKMAGLTVDEKVLQNVNLFLDSVAFEEDSRYAYNDFEPPSLSMTAEGLLCRIYLGWPSTHPPLLRAIRDDLLPTAPSAEDFEYSVYYWYYATQVLHHVGGGPWNEWNESMRRVIPALQLRAGPEAGSWDPSQDVFGASGGRLYTTCLNLYCLEVYYRHLAIYDIK